MKRINSRKIYLPRLIEKPTEGMSKDAIEEQNLRSYNYGNRTSNPTLQDFVITPFSTTFKEMTFSEAEQKFGLDENGILLKRYQKQKIFDGKSFDASVYPSKRYSWSDVLFEVQSILDNVTSDNMDSIHRQGVRKSEDATNILVEYLLSHMERLKEEYKTNINDSSFVITDSDTGKKVPPDKEVRDFRVYFTDGKYNVINQNSATDYYLADSLKNNISSVLRHFEKWAMDWHGVPTEGLEEQVRSPFEMDDGTGVTYLYYPKSEKASAGDVYNGLAMIDPSKKDIVGSTGDLQIIKRLAFKDGYEYKRGGACLLVHTENTDKVGKKGIIRIERAPKKGEPDVREYRVLNVDGKVFVHVGDVASTLQRLQEKRAPPKTQVKIDFYPNPPEYLLR